MSFTVFTPHLNEMYFFLISPILMTKLRVLILCFLRFMDISIKVQQYEDKHCDEY